MKINWCLRLKNKTTLLALVSAIVPLVYMILELFCIVPSASQNTIIEICGMVLSILALLGIITDPTTEGICDSNQALKYDKPKGKDSID